MLAGAANGPRCGARQPAPDSRRARPSPTAVSRRIAGAAVSHVCETGGMRRVHLRGHPNIRKRLLVHVRRLQLGAAAAAPDPRRHAAQPSAPGGGPVSCLDQPIARPVRLCETFLDALSVDLVANGVFTARSTSPDHLHECEDFHLRLLAAFIRRGLPAYFPHHACLWLLWRS